MNSLFKRFFSRPEPEGEMLKIETDLHSHLIPGIDDGSRSIEDSISFIRQFMQLGIHQFITTPHIMKGGFDNNASNINAGLNKLRQRLADEHLNVKINAAAEYYFDDYFISLIGKNELLTFGKKKYLLFELPAYSKPASFETAMFELITSGYQPVLAHPERYTYMHDRKLEKYEKIRDSGVLMQTNLLSYIGHYSKEIADVAIRLTRVGLIDFIGSDLHNQNQLDRFSKAYSHPVVRQLIASGQLLNDKIFDDSYGV